VRYLVCNHCNATGKEVLRLDDIGRPIYAAIATHSKTTDPQTNSHY
jgi:hypothetical protein